MLFLPSFYFRFVVQALSGCSCSRDEQSGASDTEGTIRGQTASDEGKMLDNTALLVTVSFQ